MPKMWEGLYAPKCGRGFMPRKWEGFLTRRSFSEDGLRPRKNRGVNPLPRTPFLFPHFWLHALNVLPLAITGD